MDTTAKSSAPDAGASELARVLAGYTLVRLRELGSLVLTLHNAGRVEEAHDLATVLGAEVQRRLAEGLTTHAELSAIGARESAKEDREPLEPAIRKNPPVTNGARVRNALAHETRRWTPTPLSPSEQATDAANARTSLGRDYLAPLAPASVRGVALDTAHDDLVWDLQHGSDRALATEGLSDLAYIEHARIEIRALAERERALAREIGHARKNPAPRKRRDIEPDAWLGALGRSIHVKAPALADLDALARASSILARASTRVTGGRAQIDIDLSTSENANGFDGKGSNASADPENSSSSGRLAKVAQVSGNTRNSRSIVGIRVSTVRRASSSHTAAVCEGGTIVKHSHTLVFRAAPSSERRAATHTPADRSSPRTITVMRTPSRKA